MTDVFLVLHTIINNLNALLFILMQQHNFSLMTQFGPSWRGRIKNLNTIMSCLLIIFIAGSGNVLEN